MATRSNRFSVQRFGVAFAVLAIASVSAHDHRVAAALQQSAATSSQPAPLVMAAYDAIGPGIAHHYP